MRNLRLRVQVTWIKVRIRVTLLRANAALASLDVQAAVIRALPLSEAEKRNAMATANKAVALEIKKAIDQLAQKMDDIEKELHTLA